MKKRMVGAALAVGMLFGVGIGFSLTPSHESDATTAIPSVVPQGLPRTRLTASSELPHPDSLSTAPYTCSLLREQVLRGEAWLLHREDHEGKGMDLHAISMLASTLATCRAMVSGSTDPCYTGFPVHDRFCLQMLISTELVEAHARGQDCRAVAQEYGNSAGVAIERWEALCDGMSGDQAACDALYTDNRKDTFDVECNAMRLSDPAFCENCAAPSPCGRNCAAFVGFHQAVREGTMRDLGQGGRGLLELAQSAALDPSFDCDTWFSARFDRMCKDE